MKRQDTRRAERRQLGGPVTRVYDDGPLMTRMANCGLQNIDGPGPMEEGRLLLHGWVCIDVIAPTGFAAFLPAGVRLTSLKCT
jgi:hypothetical protein